MSNIGEGFNKEYGYGFTKSYEQKNFSCGCCDAAWGRVFKVVKNIVGLIPILSIASAVFRFINLAYSQQSTSEKTFTVLRAFTEIFGFGFINLVPDILATIHQNRTWSRT